MNEFEKIQVEFAKLAMQAWLEAGAKEISLGDLNDEAGKSIFYSMCQDIANQSFELSQAMMVELFERTAKGTLNQSLEDSLKKMSMTRSPHFDKAKELFESMVGKKYEGSSPSGAQGVPQVRLARPKSRENID